MRAGRTHPDANDLKPRRPSSCMEQDDRLVKKRREAERLRDVPASETLAMGFSLVRFARKIQAATDAGH